MLWGSDGCGCLRWEWLVFVVEAKEDQNESNEKI